MMEFEDQAEEHEEEEEEPVHEEEEDEEQEDTELFSHSHPSSYNDSAPRVNSASSTPRPRKMSITTGTSTPEAPLLHLAARKGNHNQHPSAAAPARYRECLKNHAVAIGGHAVDGCGEFMPAGVKGTLDALKCAACSCHRNFHRKELVDPTSPRDHVISTALYPHHPHLHGPPHHHPPSPQVLQLYPYNSTAGPGGGGYLQLAPAPQRPSVPQLHQLVLPSTLGEVEDVAVGGIMGMTSPASTAAGMTSSKKRVRTKFTAEQKQRMLELAERIGWRLQKQDEALIQRFCEEYGVKRQVLKVWMHNNKHTLGRGGAAAAGGKKP